MISVDDGYQSHYFGLRADNFRYPAGLYDRRSVAAVRAAGYRGAATVAPGLADRRHPFGLRRIRVIDAAWGRS